MNLQFIKISLGGDLLRNLGMMLLRIVVTLVLTGAYLHYLFEIDSVFVNIVWLLVMTACTTICSIRSSRTGSTSFVLPLFAGMLAGLLVAGTLFMLCAGLFDNTLHAHFFVPVASLMLSAMLTTCATGTKVYRQSLTEDSDQYNFLVGNGASHAEALAPFVRRALESSVGQMAESTGIIQLVAMPAMFGMMLGGCPPITAMKYQLFVLLASVLSSLIALVLAIYLADTRLFDNFGRLRKAKRTATVVAFLVATMMLSSCNTDMAHRPLIGGDISESAEELTQETVDNLELPLFRTTDTILYRAGYTTCYDPANRIPRWVAWKLTSDHVSGPYSRDGKKFMEDEDVPVPRATHFDYMLSGYDRGHMCPSGDCKWGEEAQDHSFLLTNVCPQNPNLNRGDWNELENQCRAWAKKYGKIYIVCGPILLNSRHKKIGKNKVTVPEAFFKVILRTNPDTCGIGFIYRNTDGDRPKDSYTNSIDQVEKITGLDFFHQLPDDVENRIECVADYSQW